MDDNVLTITVGGKNSDFEASEFVSIVKNTIGLLRAIEEKKSGEKARIRWVVVTASKQSPLKFRMAGVERGGGSLTTPSPIEPFLTALQVLEEGVARPADFDDSMLETAKRLVRPLGGTVASIVFSDGKDSVVPVTTHVAASAERYRLPDTYSEYGELEGELGQITAHKPPYEFCIYDPITDARIPCLFATEDMPQIRDLLKERVRVDGLITYRRKDDAPISVQVEDWYALPREEGLPALSELHSKGINLTNGERAEDIIAELRRMRVA